MKQSYPWAGGFPVGPRKGWFWEAIYRHPVCGDIGIPRPRWCASGPGSCREKVLYQVGNHRPWAYYKAIVCSRSLNGFHVLRKFMYCLLFSWIIPGEGAWRWVCVSTQPCLLHCSNAVISFSHLYLSETWTKIKYHCPKPQLTLNEKASVNYLWNVILRVLNSIYCDTYAT